MRIPRAVAAGCIRLALANLDYTGTELQMLPQDMLDHVATSAEWNAMLSEMPFKDRAMLVKQVMKIVADIPRQISKVFYNTGRKARLAKSIVIETDTLGRLNLDVSDLKTMVQVRPVPRFRVSILKDQLTVASNMFTYYEGSLVLIVNERFAFVSGMWHYDEHGNRFVATSDEVMFRKDDLKMTEINAAMLPNQFQYFNYMVTLTTCQGTHWTNTFSSEDITTSERHSKKGEAFVIKLVNPKTDSADHLVCMRSVYTRKYAVGIFGTDKIICYSSTVGNGEKFLMHPLRDGRVMFEYGSRYICAKPENDHLTMEPLVQNDDRFKFTVSDYVESE